MSFRHITSCRRRLLNYSCTELVSLLLVLGSGDQHPGVKAADVVFVVAEKPHPLFRRENADLYYTHRLPLVDALCGTSFTVTHLDGRQLPITVNDVAGPNSQKIVRGEGMPQTKTGGKGDLRIQFNIMFPKHLSDEQRAGLRQYLPNM